MSRVFHGFIAALMAIVLLPPGPSLAQLPAPRTIGFMGMLNSSTGQPLNGSIPVTLSIYSQPGGGTALWTQTRTVTVVHGLFSTVLGDIPSNPFPSSLDFSLAYFVGVKAAADAEMLPRLPLQGVPYAMLAQTLPPGSIHSGLLAGDYGSLGRMTAGVLRQDTSGFVGIRDRNWLEFGAGIAGKEADAGKIGYASFTIDALDIVGAGTSASTRRIKLHAEGGASVSGPFGIETDLPVAALDVNGNAFIAGPLGIGTASPQTPLHVKGNEGILDLEGVDHCYMQFYPRGIGSGRKGYIGFPAAFSHDLEIANEDGGAVRVIGTFVNNSDVRYKTDIVPLRNALDTVLGLKGVSYNWRKDLPGLHLSSQRQIGFLAQDVEKVIPDLVYTDTGGYKSVAYVNVVPVLVEAVKTMKADNDREAQRVRAYRRQLEAEHEQNAALAERLTRLEKLVNSTRKSR